MAKMRIVMIVALAWVQRTLRGGLTEGLLDCLVAGELGVDSLLPLGLDILKESLLASVSSKTRLTKTSCQTQGYMDSRRVHE